jgi:hypothetical protein
VGERRREGTALITSRRLFSQALGAEFIPSALGLDEVPLSTFRERDFPFPHHHPSEVGGNLNLTLFFGEDFFSSPSKDNT